MTVSPNPHLLISTSNSSLSISAGSLNSHWDTFEVYNPEEKVELMLEILFKVNPQEALDICVSKETNSKGFIRRNKLDKFFTPEQVTIYKTMSELVE